MRTLQIVADAKYSDDDLQGLEKLQRRYLRPLAVSISKKQVTPAATKELEHMLDRVHTTKYLLHASSHEASMSKRYLHLLQQSRGGGSSGSSGLTTTDLKNMLKRAGLIPDHLTGSTMLKLCQTVKYY